MENQSLHRPGMMCKHMSDKLAGWLRGKLEERDWSIRHFARQVGVSHTHAAAIINQEANPSVDLLRKIADLFATPMEEVLRLYGLLPPSPDPGSPQAARERRVHYYFSRLPVEQQELILETMKAWYEASRGDKTDEG